MITDEVRAAAMAAMNNPPAPLESNVAGYLEKVSVQVGKACAEGFVRMAGMEAQLNAESPIERLMIIAFEAMRHLHYVEVEAARHVDSVLEYKPSDLYPSGVIYLPQAPIEGGYVADFIVRGRGPCCRGSDIAIELDGHAFHDRDQKQRSYEKRRDREFQHIGLRVFRYTGADVVRDPLAIATEVFKSLGAI